MRFRRRHFSTVVLRDPTLKTCPRMNKYSFGPRSCPKTVFQRSVTSKAGQRRGCVCLRSNAWTYVYCRALPVTFDSFNERSTRCPPAVRTLEDVHGFVWLQIASRKYLRSLRRACFGDAGLVGGQSTCAYYNRCHRPVYGSCLSRTGTTFDFWSYYQMTLV